jgi:hypothetical protein
MTPQFEITVFTKSGGPLTKRIKLGTDGKPESDGSACVMSSGMARRCRVNSVHALAAIINGLASNQALALGTLRPDLPEEVQITTKRRLNGAPGVVARTAEYLVYRPGCPAVVLLDYDQKGMPAHVGAKIGELGGFWGALTTAVPGLIRAARVERASTSAGLYDRRTLQRFPESGGRHVYLLVKDGADIERFLKAVHERCWLAGLGWYMVGAAGHLLERSVVDRMVGAPERLVFEGPPILLEPLAQDQDARRARAVDGAEVA